MPNKTITITQARHDIFDIAEKVQKPNNFYTLSVDGEPKVVMMSCDEFDSIMETMEILSDPEVMADIKQAQEEYKKGDYITWEEMKKELHTNRQPVFAVADKSKKKYTVRKKNKSSR